MADGFVRYTVVAGPLPPLLTAIDQLGAGVECQCGCPLGLGYMSVGQNAGQNAGQNSFVTDRQTHTQTHTQTDTKKGVIDSRVTA